MIKTTPTSSRFTDILGEHFAEGFFDELEKIAEEKKDPSFKKTLKAVALSALGTAAGTGAAMIGHEILKNTLGSRYNKLLPLTRLKILAPALAITSTALVGAGLALQNEMKKKTEGSEHV